MIDYQPLIDRWRHGELERWAALLSGQVRRGLSRERYGDLEHWLAALDRLPEIAADSVRLDSPRVGADAVRRPPAAVMAALRDALMALHPWRKGPFELFGLHLDTEWRSDWKWDRFAPPRRWPAAGCWTWAAAAATTAGACWAPAPRR